MNLRLSISCLLIAATLGFLSPTSRDARGRPSSHGVTDWSTRIRQPVLGATRAEEDGTKNVAGQDATKVILSIDGKWILEELLDQAIPLPSARDDCDSSVCYWLVQGPSPQNELAVYKNELPVPVFKKETPAGVFRLSRIIQQEKPTGHGDAPSTNKGIVSPTQASFNPGESPDIGTKLLWHDEWIKMWEFRLAPQERCDFHRHVHPYFFLNLSESLTQELDRDNSEVKDKPPNLQMQGQCTFVSLEHLSAHGVRNVGVDPFLQFVVEFL